ncbi:MAG: hypothetical protein CL840_08230 [Crocinitomicaceae bacterium]|nr:hypothetical protein [Crocinitomicaceae bacterium]|tara:strand:- start:27612 stop:28160 length:549 start_codon:yes stop_codon:yes gene_type:complete
MLKVRLTLVLFLLILGSSSYAQRYTQSGVIHTEIQLFTKNGIQINGSSKEMHVDYPAQDQKMVIRLDPHTIRTDNIDFNKQLDECLLGNFVFTSEVDASSLEFRSKYNETIEVEAEAEINNITQQVKLYLILSNKKTTNKNEIIIVGKGVINISDFELDNIFPDLEGELIFQFTQNLVVNYK